MKLINEKGKIFGKLNVIDLIALVLIIAVGAFVVLKLSGVQAGAGLGNATKLTYTVKVTDVDRGIYDSIQKSIPSQLMSSGEMLDAYVVSVEAAPSEGTTLDAAVKNGDQVTLKTKKKDTYDLIFTIEANVKNTVTNELGTQEVRVGKSHIVKTSQFELEKGVILTCETSK